MVTGGRRFFFSRIPIVGIGTEFSLRQAVQINYIYIHEDSIRVI